MVVFPFQLLVEPPQPTVHVVRKSTYYDILVGSWVYGWRTDDWGQGVQFTTVCWNSVQGVVRRAQRCISVAVGRGANQKKCRIYKANT